MIVGQLCPNCGEPPRVALVEKARVRVTITALGELGKVLSLSMDQPQVVGFECGGGHTWRKPPETP